MCNENNKGSFEALLTLAILIIAIFTLEFSSKNYDVNKDNLDINKKSLEVNKSMLETMKNEKR